MSRHTSYGLRRWKQVLSCTLENTGFIRNKILVSVCAGMTCVDAEVWCDVFDLLGVDRSLGLGACSISRLTASYVKA